MSALDSLDIVINKKKKKPTLASVRWELLSDTGRGSGAGFQGPEWGGSLD